MWYYSPKGRWALALVLAALAPMLLGGTCGQVTRPTAGVEVTLNAIPRQHNDLLVVPPSGFTVDLRYTNPGTVVSSTLYLFIEDLTGQGALTLDLLPHLAWADAYGAVAMIPPEFALPEGSFRVVALVGTTSSQMIGDSLEFAVRNHAAGPPLASPAWIQLDFELDRDGDSFPDFDDDLEALGLGAAGAQGPPEVVRDWTIGEIVARSQAFYDAPNPSDLPGGDASDLSFSDAPPGSGSFTRVCVGGEDPHGGSTLGNVMLDPGNANPSDLACDNFLPSGVFPRELLIYSGQSAFQQAFDPLLAQPVGTHPLDEIVLGPSYDPGDPAQLARFIEIEGAVAAFAQAVATIAAHESGHALGLVPKGAPGRGLFGDSGAHNQEPDGSVPVENLLMNPGSSFNFAELSGAGGQPLPRLRELNHAYLRGRLVLDARVDGIYPAPVIGSVDPAVLSLSGDPYVTLSISGENFLDPPDIRLRGPVLYNLFMPVFVSETQLTGGVILSFLQTGVYDLEVINADGQVTLLPGAIPIVP